MELFSTITEKEFFISSFSKKHMKNIMAAFISTGTFSQLPTKHANKSKNNKQAKEQTNNKKQQHIDTVKSGGENFCSFLQHSLRQ